MSQTFYHVDRHRNLEVGDILELEWPGTLIGEWENSPTSSDHLEILEELYPEGLSRHGSRYAHPKYRVEELKGLNEGWMAATGSIELKNRVTGEKSSQEFVPYIIKYEQFFELLRLLEFSNKQSRFQSYFGFQDTGEAIEFHSNHRSENEEQLVKVKCENYEIRDMDLLNANYFGEIFSRGRKYWKGESGAGEPIWEVAMEPPVEVIEIIDENIE